MNKIPISYHFLIAFGLLAIYGLIPKSIKKAIYGTLISPYMALKSLSKSLKSDA